MKKHLNEGGAAGHMAHPFDLPRVKNGMGLLKFFQDAQKVLNDAVVKIDGVKNKTLEKALLNEKGISILGEIKPNSMGVEALSE